MTQSNTGSPGRIVGIGGIFFKSGDREALQSWYKDKLGLDHGSHGVMFKWRSPEQPEKEHLTIWSIFPEQSKYFDPSRSPFMINYIVENLDALLAKLTEAGVEIDPKRENHEYGRFAWIYDPDGNKVELWEPPAA